LEKSGIFDLAKPTLQTNSMVWADVLTAFMWILLGCTEKYEGEKRSVQNQTGFWQGAKGKKVKLRKNRQIGANYNYDI
jgi:hypothetical protein